MSGKVWLVGAGPGDAGLMTIRGREVLKEADVVVYDALVSESILMMIPEVAELIFAGKRSGNHYLKQEDTNRVLLAEARKGKKVVRLKGGDPFLFGRGGEELELLADNHIPFEVVPGISSAFAVPAYNGIPVTHRDFCSSVHVITGHKRKDSSYDIDFEVLARTKGTLVFLMGIAALPDICKGLLDAGMDPDMPAAVLEQGTTAEQARICAPLGKLEETCAAREVKTPAIIVVGEVCSLADRFSWQERRPLFGIKAVVTRPKELVSSLAEMLRKEGAEVLELPTIAVVPKKDMRPLWQALEKLRERTYDWLVFTSPSGVRIFMEELFKCQDIRVLSGTKIAGIGKGTEKALGSYGLKLDFLPTVYDGETLGKELSAVLKDGEKVLIPRAAEGNKELTAALTKNLTVQVTDLPIYDTVHERSRIVDLERFFSAEQVFAVFTSASTVHGFTEAAKNLAFDRVKAVCIGKQTKAAAEKYGMTTWVAEKATLPALVECVKNAAGTDDSKWRAYAGTRSSSYSAD